MLVEKEEDMEMSLQRGLFVCESMCVVGKGEREREGLMGRFRVMVM